MKTVELMSHLRDLDIRLWLDGDRLRFSAPDGAMTPELREQLVAHKADIITFLREAKVAVQGAAPPIRPVDRGGELPLSLAQQRLWLLDQLLPGSPFYNIPQAVRLRGALDVPALKRTLDEISRRHEILRTTYGAGRNPGQPVQIIAPSRSGPLPLVDLRALPAAAREAEARRLAAEEAERPFDLARGPLLRVSLLQLDREDHVVLFTMHHIVGDAWSMGVLVNEVAALYAAFSQGRPSPLPELPIQYADFAHWQQQWLQGEVLEAHLDFWRRQLDGATAALKLPTDRPRPPQQTFRGAHYAFALPRPLSEALKALSRQSEATLFMTLLGAFATLLYHYTGQEDILIGSPVAGRNRAELEGLIGYFVNTLALRVDLQGDPSFRELLDRLREVVLGAFAHQDLPFEKILNELQPRRDQSRISVANVAFALQNAPASTLELPGLSLSPLEVGSAIAKTDLILFMSEGPAGLRGLFEYNTDLFEAATIARAAAHFQTLLEAIVAEPEQRLSMLPPRQPLVLVEEPGTRAGQLGDIYERSNLTGNQLLIWVGQQLQPDTPLFNIANTFNIQAEIDPERFQAAFQTLVNSSDALRTVIEEVDGVPRQRVLAELPARVEYLDFSQDPDPRARVRAWARERSQVLFDLAACLFDTALIKVAAGEYVWFINQHHIISDVWSKSLMFRWLGDFYRRALEGRLQPRVDLPAFEDYVAYERDFRRSERYLKTRAYWEQKLSGELEPLTFYGRAPHKTTTRVRRWSCDLGLERSRRLREMAAEKDFFGKTGDVWLFGIFAALLYTYLHRLSGNRRLAVGAAFHNRRSQAFKETIGMFMEVRPLQISIEETDTFASVIKKVMAEVAETFQHRHFAVANPLQKQAYEVFLNYHTVKFPEFVGAPVQTEWVHTGHENDSLAVQIHDYDLSGNFVLDFDFHCDVFEETQQALAIQHFLQVLDAFLADSAQPVGRVSLLSAEERERVLAGFNQRETVFSEVRTVPQRFAAQVAKTPEKVAAVHGARSLTYRQLNQQADQLANLITRLKNDSESAV